MAVNKNFVVKNGLEVATNAVLVDATSKNVGIGSTLPANTLDVRGGIGATDIIVTGVSSFRGDVQVGASGSIFYVDDSTDNVGVGTSLPAYTLDVRGPVSTGTTALYVQGDARITGDLFVDDITFDDANMQDLTVTDTLTVAGVTTLASGGGISTVGGQLYVASDISAIGVITATSFTGLGQIGVASEGTFVGTGVTLVDFKSTTGTNVQSVDISSGIASVTVVPGVSLGLAIALGG